MRHALETENIGHVGVESQVLLANFEDELLKLCKKMHLMPKAWKFDTLVNQRITSHGLPMVVCYLGNVNSLASVPICLQ